MIKVCWIKFPPFKIEKGFLAIFLFCQNHKNGQKSIFYFERWKFFSAHLNHLGRQFFCIFYTFWFDQKKWAKSKKTHFGAWPIFSVFGPKMPKISIFMKKSFSNNISMSNFGQKRFSILLTKKLYLNPLEPFCWEGYSTSPSGWNSGYGTLLSKMALAGSNIGFC